MGRISLDQQSQEFQPESNPQIEDEYHQNQQQAAFPPANAQQPAFQQANPQPAAFPPANAQQPAFQQAAFHPVNAQQAAFPPANAQEAFSAFSPVNAQEPSHSSKPPEPAVQPHMSGRFPPMYHLPTMGGNSFVTQPQSQPQVHQTQPQVIQLQIVPVAQATQTTGGPITTPSVGIPVPPMGNGGWTTGLFDCLENPLNAVLTLFFPFVTYGQVAHIADNGQSSCASNALLYVCILHFIGLPCLISIGARTKLRNQQGLNGSTTDDCMVHLCCEYCALCQEYRELQNRGLDPSIGWAANMARKQQNFVMMPPMNQMMVP